MKTLNEIKVTSINEYFRLNTNTNSTHAYQTGFDAGVKAHAELVKGLVEALSFYAKGSHFEYCGTYENEPETTSGEPINWLCGGADGHEYQYECGAVAGQALANYKKLKGE